MFGGSPSSGSGSPGSPLDSDGGSRGTARQGQCLTALDSCESLGILEPSGGTEENRWHNRGELGGDYEMVPTYVGDGRGTHTKEVIKNYTGYRPHPYVMACVFLTLFVTILTVLWELIMITSTPQGRGSNSTDGYNFDCEDGYEDWQGTWSYTKQEWCCSNTGRACPTVPFDCDVGWETAGAYWEPDKKGWCCAHYARGCPPPPLGPRPRH